MSHVHSNAEMMLASQIAYLDLKGNNTNLGKQIDNILYSYGEQDADGTWKLKPEYEGIKGIEDEFSGAKNVLKIANESGVGERWRNWNIVDVDDNQEETGYFGMMIDTGDGNAVIASRGSESTDPATMYKDWGEADFGLLDSTLTKQQARAEKFMEQLYYKYGDQYNKFSVGGHSLGGNLAMHMTITAPAGMREKIDRCTNLDGPGFSEEYLEKHREDIEKVRNLLEHFKWSIVGNLLFDVVPEEKVQRIKSEGSVGENHLLKYVQYDEHGNFIKDEQDGWEKTVEIISRHVDSMGWEVLDLAAITSGLAAWYFNLAAIAKAYSFVVRNFDELKSKLKSISDNIYYGYIAPQVSGSYEVNNKSLSNVANEIRKLEKELGYYNDDVEKIRKNLKVWTTSGAYYRSKIVCIQNGLESDLKKLKKMAQIADNAAKQYHSVDMQVKDMFY